MREAQHRRRRRRHRRDERAGDARRGGADEDDLAGVFRRRDLAAVDVEERVDRESRPAVAVLVEVGLHLEQRLGADVRLAERDALARLHLHVRRAEVAALRRDHQRERREELVVILQRERFGAHRAVDVERVGEVADGESRLAEGSIGASTPIACRATAPEPKLPGTTLRDDVVGQRLVGLAERRAELEVHRDDDVAGLGVGLGELAIGVQVLLGFA
mgnify:CR=1 FL=1